MRVHYISGHGRFVKQYSLTCPSSLRSQVAVTRTVYIIDQRQSSRDDRLYCCVLPAAVAAAGVTWLQQRPALQIDTEKGGRMRSLPAAAVCETRHPLCRPRGVQSYLAPCYGHSPVVCPSVSVWPVGGRLPETVCHGGWRLQNIVGELSVGSLICIAVT